MWFLALGEYHEHPWFLNFIDKLLEGSADVVRLLDYHRYPFKANDTDFPRVQPLDAIRAWKYEYDFTRLATSWNTGWLNASGATPVELAVGAWWSRTHKRQFLPAIQRDLPGLVSIIDVSAWKGGVLLSHCPRRWMYAASPPHAAKSLKWNDQFAVTRVELRARVLGGALPFRCAIYCTSSARHKI